MNKAELLEKVTTSRAELEQALSGLIDEQLDRPSLAGGWSGKVILAHMAWWQGRVVTIFTALRRGNDPSGPGLDKLEFSQAEVDAANRCVEVASRGRSVINVRREEAETYAALLAQVQAASEEELFNPQRFAWMGGRPLAILLEWDTWDHYQEHLPQFKSLQP
jgi:hypothetical protein